METSGAVFGWAADELCGRSSEAVVLSAVALGGSEVFGEPPLRAVKADMLRQPLGMSRDKIIELLFELNAVDEIKDERRPSWRRRVEMRLPSTESPGGDFKLRK